MVLDGDHVVGKSEMDRNVIYFYAFYCLCNIKERRMNMLEDKLGVESEPELDTNDDIIIYDAKGKH